MRIDLRRGLTLLLLCWAAFAFADEATVPMRAEKVGAHSWYVQGLPGAAARANQGFMSNAGFVVTREGVVVFDTLGTPALAHKMVGEIRKLTRQPIRRVIVSHSGATSSRPGSATISRWSPPMSG
jgi:hypothetical protein